MLSIMIINVCAKPNSSRGKVEKNDDGSFDVFVKEPPVEGRANRAIIKALAEYFGVSVFKVNIISGRASRQKIIEIK